MQEIIKAIAQWLAPLLSTAISAYIAVIQHNGESKRDEARADTDAKRAAEAQWRNDIEQRMDDQDEKIGAILKGQTTQMRSDLVHKAHRYIDDLGCASMEEKDAYNAEYEDYCAVCEKHGIKNNFVDKLARQVMELPDRTN